jgi:hypothetical protein
VVLPWLVNVVFLMKLFPPNIADKMAKFVGAHKLMSDFKGKGDVNARIPGLGDKK